MRQFRLRSTRTTLVAAVIAVLVAAPVSAAEPASDAEVGSSDWRQVSTGTSHTCGIRTTGRLYCWGNDDYGQLGDGGTDADRSTPTLVAGGATNWTTVSAGGFHTCARRTTGRLYCWGNDDFGEVGDGGTDTDRGVPTLVAGGATTWTAVSAGRYHTCARRTTGRIYCWGNDDTSQLGDGGTDTDRGVPTLVAGGATNWTAVSAGGSHSCARRTTGRLYCWGYDGSGQVGDGGTNTSRTIPTLVAGGATNWTAVSAGGSHSCARRTTGRLYCWGQDDNSQLGDGGTDANRPVPTLVAGGATDWATVAAGTFQTCGRRSTGRLYCWGLDLNGQLGDGGANTDRAEPVQVAGGATDWTLVDTGGHHTCARIRTGRLFCWGYNFDGEVGDNSTTPRNAPAQVHA